MKKEHMMLLGIFLAGVCIGYLTKKYFFTKKLDFSNGLTQGQ